MRIVLIILAVLVVLVAAVVAAPFLVPRDWLVAKVSDVVRDATGRPFAIGGDVSLSLIPTPRLVAEDIRVGEGEKPLLQVGRLEAVVAAVPLLSGRVDVQRFVVDAPVVNLRVDRNGVGNWQGPQGGAQKPGAGGEAGGGGGGLPELALGEVRVQDGVVDYADARSGFQERVEDIDVELAANDLQGPASVTGSAQVRGQKVGLDLAVAKVGELIAKASSPGSIRLTGPVAASLEGVLSATPSGTARVEIADVGKALQWLKVDAPAGAPLPRQLVVSGKLDVKGQVVSFADAKIDSDLLQADGNVRFDGSGKRPKIDGALNTGVIDAARLMPAAEEPAPPAAGQAPQPAGKPGTPPAGPAAADTPLNVPTSLPVDLDVKLAAKGVKAPRVTLGPTRLRATSGPNHVLVDLQEVQAYSGKVTGRVNAAADAQGVPRLAVKLAGAGLAIQPLLRDLAKQDRLEGRAAINLDVTGDGRTVGSLLGGLDGRADMTLLNGAVQGFDLSKLSGNPMEIAAKLAQGGLSGGSTQIGRASTSFAIANGIATTDDIIVQTPVAQLTGGGRLNLAAQRIEQMRLVAASAKGGSFGDVPTIPILISGPFNAPSVTVDTEAALRELAKDPKTVGKVIDQVNKLGGGKDGKGLIPGDAGKLLKGILGGGQ